MSTFQNITPEQQQQALAMALLTGGAQMMNPVGTFGNAGAQFSRGVQQGMGTFMPMMQFYQQSNLAKEDRDYKKSRDKTMDRFRKNQESAQAIRLDMAQQQLDISRENADSMRGLRSLQEQQLQMQIDLANQRKEFMSQFMPGPKTLADANAGAGEGMKPIMQYGGGDQLEMLEQRAGAGLPQLGQVPMPGVQPQVMSAPQAPQPRSQFQSMDPYTKQTLGGYFDLPGVTAQGKDEAEIEKYKTKKLIDKGLEDGELTKVTDPLGLGYIVVHKKTMQPIGKYDASMNFTPNPNVKVVK